MSHRYTVEFRVYGRDLKPEELTQDLGLIPCQTVVAGSFIGPKFRERAMWAFSGSDDGLSLEWETLEDGLNFVLERLASKKSVLEKYRFGNKLIWWCGHFQSSFDGGPTLSPETLKRLGDFGVELFLDCYFSEDNSESDV